MFYSLLHILCITPHDVHTAAAACILLATATTSMKPLYFFNLPMVSKRAFNNVANECRLRQPRYAQRAHTPNRSPRTGSVVAWLGCTDPTTRLLEPAGDEAPGNGRNVTKHLNRGQTRTIKPLSKYSNCRQKVTHYLRLTVILMFIFLSMVKMLNLQTHPDIHGCQHNRPKLRVASVELLSA